jgi:shikimate dehydrogenase
LTRDRQPGEPALLGHATGFRAELVGCLSQGADGNPTVAMIEAAFADYQLPWRYVNIEVAPAGLADAVKGAWAMGFRGFNLSMPHKVSVIPFLGGLGDSAAEIGAVNCVVRRDDRFIGENTDGKGFLASLQERTDPRGKSVVLLGAGGAARAIAVELALAGCGRITVVNRSEDRGAELVRTLQRHPQVEARLERWRGDFPIPEGSDIVINGTSIGLYEPRERVPVALASLRPGMIVADVVFSPPRPRFLREAESQGCATLDGLGMLVNQGVIGVRYWTGIEPDAGLMRRALERALGS